MNTFCVYYDLDHPDQQYPLISAYLCNFPAFTRMGERMWLINTNTSSSSIISEINALNMPRGFRVMIIRAGEDWASHGLREQTAAWLKHNWRP
jgi:hypothetical protein